jgi:hypothetical protein
VHLLTVIRWISGGSSHSQYCVGYPQW